MATISGGQAFWFPVGSEDYVRVTEDVMSYEVDGELRLSQSFGTVEVAGLKPTEDDEEPAEGDAPYR